MNQQFFELPKEKQSRIINAAMEVFAQNEYKRASTELIASKAQISKGLLFYYFHNKKELYLYTFSHLESVVKEYAVDNGFKEITDFFELMHYASQRKIKLMKENPYIMEFAMRCFYSQGETVSQDMNHKTKKEMGNMYQQYFSNIDISKFKEEINPVEVLTMITWMTDGYIHEKQISKQNVNMDELMQNMYKWTALLKKAVYKEEFQ